MAGLDWKKRNPWIKRERFFFFPGVEVTLCALCRCVCVTWLRDFKQEIGDLSERCLLTFPRAHRWLMKLPSQSLTSRPLSLTRRPSGHDWHHFFFPFYAEVEGMRAAADQQDPHWSCEQVFFSCASAHPIMKHVMHSLQLDQPMMNPLPRLTYFSVGTLLFRGSHLTAYVTHELRNFSCTYQNVSNCGLWSLKADKLRPKNGKCIKKKWKSHTRTTNTN